MLEHVGWMEVLTLISFHLSNNTYTNLGVCVCVAGLIHPPCWFSLKDSQTVKVVTLAFSSIQQNFIKSFRAKFGVPNSPLSSDIGQNSDEGVSNFLISGQRIEKKIVITPEPVGVVCFKDVGFDLF